MFDIGWGEFVLVGVVALVVIGPKELPGVLRTVGRTVGKVKRLAGEFQGQFQDAMRDMELEEARKTVEGLNNDVSSSLNTSFNPIQTIRDELRGTPATADVPPVTPEPQLNLPDPPPVPDLTPEQIQAAFAPVVPETAAEVGPVSGSTDETADATPAKPKRSRKKPTPAVDEEVLSPVALGTAPVDPGGADAPADEPAPKRRSRAKVAGAEASEAAPRRRKSAVPEASDTEDGGNA